MLQALFTSPLVLAIIGSLLIAWDISKKDKKPFIVISGLVFLGLMVLVRFKIALMEGAIWGLFTGVSSDLGIALLISAGYLAVRKSKAKPFFVLGVMALVLSLALALVGRILGFNHVNESSFLLELGPDDQIEEVQTILADYDVHAEKAFPALTLAMDADLAQVYLITGRTSQMDQLMAELRLDTENVDHVALNTPVSLSPPLVSDPSNAWKNRRPIVANDPLSSNQWMLEAINASAVHEILKEY